MCERPVRWLAVVLATVPLCGRADGDALWQQSPETIRSAVSQVRAGRDLTPAAWPDGARVAVGLSFDVDTELVWLTGAETESPATMSRGQYGARTGLDRVLSLLRDYGIPATFFVPAMTMELHPEVVTLIQADGRHELAFHSYAHENPLELDPASERAAYEKGLALFQRHAGVRPLGFRSASWDLTPATIDIIQELGFRYDSSLMADDRPYQLISGGRDSDLVELPVEWILDDWPYFQLDWDSGEIGLRSADEVFPIWRDEFDGAWQEGTLFVLTMHPQVIGHRYRIRMLRRLIEHMKSRPGVWFATQADIAAHVVQPGGD